MLTSTHLISTSLSTEDAHVAESSRLTLERIVTLHDGGKDSLQFQGTILHLNVQRPNGDTAELSVPAAALPLLVSLLTELGRGKTVAVVATDSEISTQQAADYMNVSRPYLVKLVDQGKIASRKVGVRRRVRLDDVLRYMEDTGDAASKALDHMAAENQRLGLYP